MPTQELLTAQLAKLLDENTRRAEAALRAQQVSEEQFRLERERHALEVERSQRLAILVDRLDEVLAMLYVFMEISPFQTALDTQTGVLNILLEIMRIIVARLIGTGSLVDPLIEKAGNEIARNRDLLDTYDLELFTPLGTSQSMHPATLIRLRSTMSMCCPTSSELMALFVDSRIAPFKSKISINGSRITQINALINELFRSSNEKGENALILFLAVLSENMDPHDSCYRKIKNLIEYMQVEC